jgi:phage gp46-like protein
MDFLFFETGDGGDMNYQNGDVKLDKSLFSSVYLAHFGGNRDVIEKNDNTINVNRAWWGNLFTRDKEQLKLISNLETALRNTALNSLAPEKLKIAAEKDLNYLVEAGVLNEFQVSITIESQINVKVTETLIEPSGQQTNLSLIWDNTKQVVISDYQLPATTKQELVLLTPEAGDIVNNFYFPMTWTNKNVYAVNVGYIKDGVKTVVESDIIGRTETIFYTPGQPKGEIDVFVENAGYTDIKDQVTVNNPLYVFWQQPSPFSIYDPRDVITFDAAVNALSTLYPDYVLTYELYTPGTNTRIDLGIIGVYSFGSPNTFTFRDYSALLGRLELTASIPNTNILNKITIIIQ